MMDSTYTSIIMYAKDQRKNVYPLVFLFFIPRCSVWSIGGFYFFLTWKPGKAPFLITLYQAFPERYATHGGCNRPKTARYSHGGYIMRLILVNQRW